MKVTLEQYSKIYKNHELPSRSIDHSKGIDQTDEKIKKITLGLILHHVTRNASENQKFHLAGIEK
jgi:hypothetical protein